MAVIHRLAAAAPRPLQLVLRKYFSSECLKGGRSPETKTCHAIQSQLESRKGLPFPAGKVHGNLANNMALSACERMNLWQQAVHILAEMVLLGALVTRGPAPDLVSYNAVMGACAGQHQWQVAVSLFVQLPSRGIVPDAISLSAVVDACRKGSQLGLAKNLSRQWTAQCMQATLKRSIPTVSKSSSKLPLPDCPGLPLIPRYAHVAVSTLVTRTLWSEALSIFWALAPRVRIDNDMLNAVLRAYQLGQRSSDALAMLRQAERRLPASFNLPDPDRRSYHMVMEAIGIEFAREAETIPHALAGLSGWPHILQLLEDLCNRRLQPNTRTLNLAATACSRCHAWQQASTLLRSLHDRQLQWDIFTYNAAIQVSHRSATSASGAGDLGTLLRRLHAQRLQPNAVVFTTAIGACERSHRWEEAIHFLRLGEGEVGNLITYNSVMGACAAGSEWRRSVGIFQQVLEKGLQPDSASMANLLKAYGAASGWQHACWALFDLQSALGCTTSWQHYLSVADCCGMASEWQHALRILFDVPSKIPTVYRYSAAIGACKNGLAASHDRFELWRHALALFSSSAQLLHEGTPWQAIFEKTGPACFMLMARS